MKRIVYLAMPYRGKTTWEIERNVHRAREISLALWKAGNAVVCPHANTAHFDGELPDSVWLEGDLAILSRCDILILGPGWESSEGVAAEKEYAELLGIPVKVYGGPL